VSGGANDDVNQEVTWNVVGKVSQAQCSCKCYRPYRLLSNLMRVY
jgi:hypothetical protein